MHDASKVGLAGEPPAMESEDDGAPLLDRTVHAFGWQFATVAGKYLLQFVVVAILSRLLSPGDFGLVGQAMIFIGLANLFSDIGVAPALIQRKRITESHIRVAFTFSVVSGALMTSLAWLLCWIPARLFHNEALEPLLQLLSFTLLFKSWATTANCLLIRRLDFRTSFWVNIGAYLLSSAGIGVAMAMAGSGAWALAWAYVVQDALVCLILMVVARHPMKPLFARKEAGELLGFGVGLTLSRLMNYATHNLDLFVVGRWLGAAPLGLYTRAYQLVTVSNETFAQVLGRVLFPAFAKMQDDSERLSSAFQRAVAAVALLGFPIFAGLAVVAPEAVLLVFGSQWGGAVLPVQILCVGGIFWSITTLSDQVAHATAAVYNLFRRRMVLSAAIFAGAWVGSRYGLNGVAIGVSISLVLNYLMMAELALRLTSTSWRQFWICQMPGFGVTLLILLGSHAMATLLRVNEFSPLLTLVLTVLTGVTIGSGLVLGLPRARLPEYTRWSLDKMDDVIARVAMNLQGRGLPVPFFAGRVEK